MNILLTCAGRRNYLVNYFKEALNGDGKVIASDAQLNAPALVDADIAVKVPSIYAENYIETLQGICKEYDVKAVISLNDLELPILSTNRKKLEDLGVTVIVSDTSVIDIAFDKWKTVQFLDSIAVKTAKTFINLEEALRAIENGSLKFPLVIKPRWGSASIGIEFPETLDELKKAYELLTLRLSKTILADASKEDATHAILIQEKLDGQEYGMDVLNDLEGNFIAAFAKKKLAMRAGETDKSVSIIDDRFTQTGTKLGTALKHIGNLDCDIFEYNNELYVLELNPRFGGGYPFTHESGAKITKAIIEWLNGNNNVNEFLNFQSGLAFSKCDRLMSVPV